MANNIKIQKTDENFSSKIERIKSTIKYIQQDIDTIKQECYNNTSESQNFSIHSKNKTTIPNNANYDNELSIKSNYQEEVIPTKFKENISDIEYINSKMNQNYDQSIKKQSSNSRFNNDDIKRNQNYNYNYKKQISTSKNENLTQKRNEVCNKYSDNSQLSNDCDNSFTMTNNKANDKIFKPNDNIKKDNKKIPNKNANLFQDINNYEEYENENENDLDSHYYDSNNISKKNRKNPFYYNYENPNYSNLNKNIRTKEENVKKNLKNEADLNNNYHTNERAINKNNIVEMNYDLNFNNKIHSTENKNEKLKIANILKKIKTDDFVENDELSVLKRKIIELENKNKNLKNKLTGNNTSVENFDNSCDSKVKPKSNHFRENNVIKDHKQIILKDNKSNKITKISNENYYYNENEAIENDRTKSKDHYSRRKEKLNSSTNFANNEKYENTDKSNFKSKDYNEQVMETQMLQKNLQILYDVKNFLVSKVIIILRMLKQ